MAVTPGTLDLSYGVNGVAPAFSQSLTLASQLALDANDSSLVFQHRIIGGVSVPALVRYTSSGAVDLSFGTNGIVENLFGTGDSDFFPFEIGVDHLQRIVILGQNLNTLDLQIVRLQADGNLDLSFSDDGRNSIVLPNSFVTEDLLIQPDGRIVLAGAVRVGTQDNAAAIRVAVNGALDSSFGNGGLQVYYDQAESTLKAIDQLADGTLVAIGRFRSLNANNIQEDDFLSLRTDRNGVPIASYGTDGIVKVDFDLSSSSIFVEEFAVAADGKLVIVGGLYDSNFIANSLVFRVNTIGQLDSTFGLGGITVLEISSETDTALDIAIAADNRLIVSGYINGVFAEDSQGYVLRLNVDGQGDGSFAVGGIKELPFAAAAINLQRNGDTVGLAGSTFGSVEATFRLHSGTLPTSWKFRDSIQLPDTSVDEENDNQFFFGRQVAIDGFFTVVGSIDPPVPANPNIPGPSSVFVVDSFGHPTKLTNPNPVVGRDTFGRSLDIDSGNIAVGDAGARAVYLYDTNGDLLRTITSPSTQSSDLFGFSVAIFEDYVVVGAPGANQGANAAGRAYLFNRNTGALLRTFGNPTPAAEDGFGFDVAVSGTRVLIGSAALNTDAHLFNLSTGALVQTLLPSASQPVIGFGADVDLSASYAAVGSRNGYAAIFDAATGQPTNALFNKNPPPFDTVQSLTTVALAGQQVALGAAYSVSEGIFSGMVSVFDIPTGDVIWDFSSANPALQDVASNIAMDDEFIYIGAPGVNTPPYSAEDYEGAVFKYSLTDGSLQAVYTERHQTALGEVLSMAATATHYIVGRFVGDFEIPDKGRAFIYTAKDNVQRMELLNPQPNESGLFGGVVAINEKFAFVSDRIDGLPNIPVAGAVYKYDIHTGALLATFISPQADFGEEFGNTMAANEEVLIVGASHNSTANVPGKFYIYDVNTNQLLRTIFDPTPTTVNDFGFALAINGDLLFASDNEDNKVYAINWRTGALVNEFQNSRPSSAGSFGKSLASAGDVLLVSGATPGLFSSGGDPVFVFNVRTGALERVIEEVNETTLFGQSIDTDGSVAVVGDPDMGMVYVYDLSTGELLQSVPDLTQTTRWGSQVRLIPVLPGESTIGAYLTNATNGLLIANEQVFAAGFGFSSLFLVSNSVPHGISLSNNSVPENSPTAVVGNLAGFDNDVGDTFSFRLVPGQGDTDNNKFTITGNRLDLITPANFESQSSFRVRIAVADQDGSSFERYFTIQVTNRNDAPVLDTAIEQLFPTINEDNFNSTGHAIQTLISGVTDEDAGAMQGIAVTSVTGSTTGKWQYTLDGGTTWFNVGTVTNSMSLLLPSNGTLSKLRYVPNTNFNGTVQLSYRAWDQTSGTVGSKVNTATAGGTTAFSTAIETATLTVSPVNDAPVLNTTPVQQFPTINEDTFNSTGQTILSLVSGVTDVDAGSLKGIAIISVTGTATGNWQYTLNGGTNWIDMGTVSGSSSLLLPSNSALRKLRYVPNANFNGTVRITYRAWDQTIGTVGSRVNTATAGGATAFSTAIETATLTVSPVNDAPVLNTTPVQQFPTINEDTFNSTGQTILSLVSGVTDVDAGSLKGIAIAGVTGSTTGKWQYTLNGGTTWVNVGAVSSSGSLLLPSNGTLSKLRYVPNANFNGEVRITYRAWDQIIGTVGSRVNTATAGGATAFSNTIETATLTVNPVNDAPQWLSATPIQLGSISNSANSPTYLVSSLLTGLVSDADSGALQGIAVTALTPITAGTLWYQLNGSTVWTQVTAVSSGSSLLLPSDAKLQFRPAVGFVGVFRANFRVWDRTMGAIGGRAALNTSGSTGGATAFSSQIGTAELQITN